MCCNMEIELLAPAGNLEALKAAVEGGADAVYLGGTKYNARAFAENFNEDNLIEAIRYAHIRGVKVYVTVNVLIKDEEIADALNYIQYLYNNDTDGIIVQDIGLLYLIKKILPDFSVHCSTQMTIHSSDGVNYLKQLGADRFVLARELSLREIEAIKNETGAELEIFVHGALCVCYSGQCLMSSMIGGRSGNRGRCAQPCRKKYILKDLDKEIEIEYLKSRYLLSTKDLNTYENLYEIMKSGVYSLKIEGRMKKPEYVAIVVKNYRDAIDFIKNNKKTYEDKNALIELESAFNRGFTKGFLFNEISSEIVNIDRPDNRGVYIGKVLWQKGNNIGIKVENDCLNEGDGIEILLEKGKSIGTKVSKIIVNRSGSPLNNIDDIIVIRLRRKVNSGSIVYKTYDKSLDEKVSRLYFYKNKKKVVINCKITIRNNQRPNIIVWDDENNKVFYESIHTVVLAEKVSLSAERIKEQLRKTGDTPYVLDSIEVIMDKDCFLPMSVINEMRRESLIAMDAARACKNNRSPIEVNEYSNEYGLDSTYERQNKSGNKKANSYTAALWSIENVKAALSAGVDSIYYGGSDNIKEVVYSCKKRNTLIFYLLPNIIKDIEKDKYQKIIEENDFDGIVISNIGQLSYAKVNREMQARGNYTLNLFNKISFQIARKLGLETICPSIELNMKQLKLMAKNYADVMEVMVYGQLPVMTMEYCPVSLISECSECQRKKSFALIDEKGESFPIFCNNYKTHILNCHILYMAEEMNKIIQTGINRVRLDFYKEKPEMVTSIINLFKDYSNLNDANYLDALNYIKKIGYTKGHYFRGVD